MKTRKLATQCKQRGNTMQQKIRSEMLQPQKSIYQNPLKQGDWGSIYAEHAAVAPMEICNSSQLLLIGILLGCPLQLDWQVGDSCKWYKQLISPNEFHILSPKTRFSARYYNRTEILVIALDPTFMGYVIHQTMDTNDVELIHHCGGYDSTLRHFGKLFQAELNSGGLGGQLYIESLASALIIHLLRCHSTFNQPSRETISQFSRHKIQQIKSYIHDNLDQSLALHELAALAQTSPYYFCRFFKQTIGLTPHQYVIQQRVERAKQLLLKGELTIAQVAYNVGFTHQSHLNRHFKRWLGVNPKMLLENREQDCAT